MKLLIYLTAFSLVGACATKSYKERVQELKESITVEQISEIQTYANTITAAELKKHLYPFASAKFEGRRSGSKGQKLAADFLKNYYIKEGIASPYGGDDYFQEIPSDYFGNEYNASENVIAFIEGSEIPEEVIVISAHYDHEGIAKNGEIYYGADDDGSGTVALLEMAQAFQQAKRDGVGPKRSILLLHTTAEEIGLQGSRYYTEHPVIPLENTVANLNIDMIGRIDKRHKDNDNYIYLIGSDRLSSELHYISEAVNQTLFNLELDYKYNDKDDNNRYYYRSDHYNFAQHNIPVIFYFNGEHEDYHKVTDTPDKINYPLLEKRTKLIFATVWQLANQEKRLSVSTL